MSKIVKTTILLKNIEDFTAVNEVYERCKYHNSISTSYSKLFALNWQIILNFPESTLATTIYEVKSLQKGGLVSIEAIVAL